MSLAKKLSAAGNNSFPNVDETYEMKVSGTQTIESGEKSYFLVNFKGKRISDEKDVEHSTILNKEVEISKKEANEIVMVTTTERDGKAYPKVVFSEEEE